MFNEYQKGGVYQNEGSTTEKVCAVFGIDFIVFCKPRGLESEEYAIDKQEGAAYEGCGLNCSIGDIPPYSAKQLCIKNSQQN